VTLADPLQVPAQLMVDWALVTVKAVGCVMEVLVVVVQPRESVSVTEITEGDRPFNDTPTLELVGKLPPGLKLTM
jgi:hypothetical protein